MNPIENPGLYLLTVTILVVVGIFGTIKYTSLIGILILLIWWLNILNELIKQRRFVHRRSQK